MLIVSKFHDYYDTACVYGVDKEYVYIRTEEVLKGTFGKSKGNRGHWPYEETYAKTKSKVTINYTIHKRVIGFCGNLYPVIVVEKKSSKEGSKIERFSFYSTAKVHSFFEKEDVALKDNYSYWSPTYFSIKSDKSLDHFFGGSEFKALEKEFHNHKCPIFVYGRFPEDKSPQGKEKLVLNPKLKDYRFAQIKDPVTAFQDVYMFIAGVLGLSHMEMPEFSDKLKAQQKGHDGKYSFKKPPGKRGKNKWR